MGIGGKTLLEIRFGDESDCTGQKKDPSKKPMSNFPNLLVGKQELRCPLHPQDS